jgi:uncharacterized small protein (DUF1192 family)
MESNIVLKGSDIDNKVFSLSMAKLCNHDFSPKTAYNISYISKRIQTFTKELMREHAELVKKYVEKDEDGEFKRDEKGFVFSDENKAKYMQDLKSVHEIEFEINKKKLDVNLLSQEGFRFNANDISALESLLCGLED